MARLLPDWIDSFIEFSNYNLEPPRMFKLWTAVSVIAAALQRKCCIQWETSIYPNMYIILVAPPGVRKGTAMRPGESLLRELGIPLSSQAVTREALIRELREAGSSHMGTCVAPDGSVRMHASLTVFSEELSVFLGHQNVILMADLANWFDCADYWTYKTKSQGTDAIVGVFFNLFGATTPEQIRTAMPVDLIGIGLSSRMIFVYEEAIAQPHATPFITPGKKALREKLLSDLTQIHLLSGDFTFQQAFIDKYTEWYTIAAQRPAFNDQRFAGYFVRRSVHLRKLCMILNASRTDDMVLTGDDFDKALHILTLTERKMPMTFMGFGRSPGSMSTIQILQFILEQKRPVRRSELLRMFYRDMDLRTCESLLNSLAGMGVIRMNISVPDPIIEATDRAKSQDLCELLMQGGFSCQ